MAASDRSKLAGNQKSDASQFVLILASRRPAVAFNVGFGLLILGSSSDVGIDLLLSLSAGMDASQKSWTGIGIGLGSGLCISGLESIVALVTCVLGEVRNRLQWSVLLDHSRGLSYLLSLDVVCHNAPSFALNGLDLLLDVLFCLLVAFVQNFVLQND